MGNPLKFRNRISGDADKGSKPTQQEGYSSDARCPRCGSRYFGVIEGKVKCLVCGWC